MAAPDPPLPEGGVPPPPTPYPYPQGGGEESDSTGIPTDDSCSEASIDEEEFNEYYPDQWNLHHEGYCECDHCEKFRKELSAPPKYLQI